MGIGPQIQLVGNGTGGGWLESVLAHAAKGQGTDLFGVDPGLINGFLTLSFSPSESHICSTLWMPCGPVAIAQSHTLFRFLLGIGVFSHGHDS